MFRCQEYAQVIAYASRTGTKKNLEMLRLHDWRLMISATGVHASHGFAYAIDNGAWTAYQRGVPFDAVAFKSVMASHGAGADFVVVPDIVAGGDASLEFSLRWIPELREKCRMMLIAVQDGMDYESVSRYLSSDVGIFVGGTTEWKLATMRGWAELARSLQCYCHVGRVNTVRRIKLCSEYGVDSFDGTSASMYRKNVRKLDNARRQQWMF